MLYIVLTEHLSFLVMLKLELGYYLDEKVLPRPHFRMNFSEKY